MCKYSFGFLARRSSRMLRQISDKVSALERCREQDSAEYEERKKINEKIHVFYIKIRRVFYVYYIWRRYSR